MGGEIRKVMEDRRIPNLAQAVSTQLLPVLLFLNGLPNVQDFQQHSIIRLMIFSLQSSHDCRKIDLRSDIGNCQIGA
jgi:hypothetical protein